MERYVHTETWTGMLIVALAIAAKHGNNQNVYQLVMDLKKKKKVEYCNGIPFNNKRKLMNRGMMLMILKEDYAK